MMCKELIRIVIISLLFFLGTAEGAKLWSGASSITAVQGQSVTMQWIVNLTSIDSSKTWTYAKIIQAQDGKTTDLMSLQKSGTKTINDARYQSRESDLNLNVSQSGATVTIKLTINNLVRSTDEKHYKAMLGFSSDSSTLPGATSLIISERPHFTTIAASPNQTSYCVNDRITITCVSRAHPSAKYSLYRNNQLVQSGGSSGVFAVSTAVRDRVFTCVPYNTVGTGQNRSFQVYVKEPPKILWCKINEAITTNRTFVEGSKVTMMCKISGSEPMDVTWILINASPPLEWNQRNLTFNAISRKEEGWYRMNVNNGKECNTTESATFHVEVNYKPVGTSISVLPNQSTFCINDQIVISCKTEAKPLPEFSLYQNNQLIQKGSKSGSLRLFLLVKGEMVLDCVSSNAVGSGQSKSLRVFVKEPPSISGCKVNNLDQTNITVKEGAKVTFSCEFSGSRPLNVTWTKESQTDIHWNQWNLTIHSVQRNDYGIYRVTVYNGKECNTAVSRTFSLVVNYKPVDTSMSVLPNQSTFCINDQIVITCKTEAKPLPEFSLYQNNQLIQKGSKSGSLRLFLLVKGEMVLDCVSSNRMGSGQSKSLRVFVKEPPSISGCKVNNLDQTNITVKEGAKVTFSCEFSGSRPLNVTWTKESQTDIHWNQWNLTIHSVQRNDYGIYRVTVYNGKECNTAVSRTFSLVVNYMNKLQVVGNNFNVFNKSTTSVNFEILIDAYPNVTLTCQSPQLKEELIFVQRNKKGSTKMQFIVTANTTNADSNIRLICKAENEVDSQIAGFLIYKQGDAKIVTGSMKLVGQDWRRDFSNVNSEAHKTLRGKCMKMLSDVYNDIPYVQKWDVLRFTPGSVVLYFNLHVIADVSDAFSPLTIGVAKNGGFVGNLEVDPTSIRKIDVTDIERSNQSQTRNSTDIIIAFLGVIVAVSLVIHIILVVLLLRAKAASKSKRHVYDDPNLGSDNDHPHQGGIPLGERSSLPDSNPDDYDQPYHEIDNMQAVSHSQTQANIGRDNPTLNRSLPALPAEMDENQDQTQEISPTSTAAENDEAVGVQKGKPKRTCGIVEPASVGNKSEQQDEEANEPLKPPIPEVSAESSKGYNQLDRSTKLPPRDSRPTLQKQKSDENQMSSLIYTHKYQNRKENQSPSNSQDNKAVTLDERKPQKICEAQKSNVDSETELQKENSEDYNRLSHSTMRETTKNSRPVSYEIPMLSSEA